MIQIVYIVDTSMSKKWKDLDGDYKEKKEYKVIVVVCSVRPRLYETIKGSSIIYIVYKESNKKLSFLFSICGQREEKESTHNLF